MVSAIGKLSVSSGPGENCSSPWISLGGAPAAAVGRAPRLGPFMGCAGGTAGMSLDGTVSTLGFWDVVQSS